MLLRHRALTAAGWAVARVRHFDLFQPPPPAVAPALAAAPSGGGGRDVARRGPFQGGARAPPHTAMLAHEDEGLAIIDRLLSAAGVWRRLEASEASRAALPSLRSQLSASSL